MDYFVFWVIQGISISAGPKGGGGEWEMLAGKGGWKRVFMDHLECMGDVWIGC